MYLLEIFFQTEKSIPQDDGGFISVYIRVDSCADAKSCPVPLTKISRRVFFIVKSARDEWKTRPKHVRCEREGRESYTPRGFFVLLFDVKEDKYHRRQWCPSGGMNWVPGETPGSYVSVYRVLQIYREVEIRCVRESMRLP